ncbi:SUKH-3 domain-containing protein [Hamadaea sp. NPDC051192]|uniref:SUKH-3 domain-containing protein n=1 Tax=Hamadaea sp. NPDC051192 TaxID=3154940 RepID=UPI0034257A69
MNITEAQARDIAQNWARGYHPESQIWLHPFELGYVVGRDTPEYGPEDGIILDAHVRAIIDGDTGAVTVWSALPPEAVADAYRAVRRAADRFSPQTLALLRLAGWRPGRDAASAVDRWWSRCAPPGTPLPNPIRTVLREFAALRMAAIGLAFEPTSPSATEPVDMFDHNGRPALVVARMGKAELIVDAAGGVFRRDGDAVQPLGDDFDQALARVLGRTA